MKEIEAAAQFVNQRAELTVFSFGTGNVNDTFLVTILDDSIDLAHSQRKANRFVLQRINQKVFRKPDLILANMRIFTDFIHSQLANHTQEVGRRWDVPVIIPTTQGDNYYVDGEGGVWRAISMIENAHSHLKIRHATHAFESGYALGRFHALISELDTSLLHDTLPGFHVTPGYLQSYDSVLQTGSPIRGLEGERREDVTWAIDFVAQRRAMASVLQDAVEVGKLSIRTMHGDPKVDNIMIDETTGQAVGMVDLDTVKPGLVHYDIGDCLRSCCNPVGEETTDFAAVRFDVELCCQILQGYLSQAASFFSPNDFDYVYDSIRLIAFELGLRFFSDFLANDVYFKVRYSTHNLDRGLVQFRLVESIEAQEAEIRAIVDQFREA